MDQATQQNAALVEEMAAAAGSLSSQAQELVQAVAVFKLDPSLGGSGGFKAQAPRSAPRPAATAPAVARAAAPRPGIARTKPAMPAKAAALAAPAAPRPAVRSAAPSNDDWESF
ncbi:MAG TPA: methyl-accepting chemotaxis protein, partial [Comamonadaceae bacterium]|nr:methyl-accepting chemotaxis protein [Comamonadaceae bacterium]